MLLQPAEAPPCARADIDCWAGAHAQVRQGEAITITYGAQTNAQLLLNCGLRVPLFCSHRTHMLLLECGHACLRIDAWALTYSHAPPNAPPNALHPVGFNLSANPHDRFALQFDVALFSVGAMPPSTAH